MKIRHRVKNRGSILAKEIWNTYAKTFKLNWFERWLSRIGLGRLWIADDSYKPLNLARLEIILEKDPTNLEKYKLEQDDHFDCDDYAYRLMGVLHQDRELAAMPIFNTWILIPEGGHALLSFYLDNEVWLLEPQNDHIYRVPEGTKLIKMDG